MHFRLQPYCSLVEGAARGAVYNFQTGKVHSINKSATNIIKFCSDSPFDEQKQSDWLSFLEKLCEMGLGSLYVNTPSTRCTIGPAEQPKLDFLWLELTSACNNQCLHCYTTSGPSIISKTLPHSRWLSIIKEAATAGATAIQFIGGEPLLYPSWRELVREADSQHFAFIEIFTNATLIDPTCIDFFKNHHVNIATTLYSNQAAIHDAVTQQPGSFDKTMQAIRLLLAAKIPLRIASILMKTNQYEAENIVTLLTELGVDPNPPDVVRPTGRGDDKDLLPDHYSLQPIRPPFFTDQQSFAKTQHYHECLAGKIAITASGDVIPCIFSRTQLCGNVATTSLAEILNGPRLLDIWQTTKDCVTKCKDCEYRYACHDCRPQAQGADGNKNWLACPSGCAYDPYTGKWKEELPRQ